MLGGGENFHHEGEKSTKAGAYPFLVLRSWLLTPGELAEEGTGTRGITANGRQWTRITAVKRAADMERHQAHRPNLAVGHDVGSAAPTTRTLPIPNNSRKTGGET